MAEDDQHTLRAINICGIGERLPKNDQYSPHDLLISYFIQNYVYQHHFGLT
jgi:hypothetical protein